MRWLILVFLFMNFVVDAQQIKCDGYNKIYNDNNDIWMDGNFKNCRLWEGKAYIYDTDGLLNCIHIYKKGIYHSNGIIQDGNLNCDTKDHSIPFVRQSNYREPPLPTPGKIKPSKTGVSVPNIEPDTVAILGPKDTLYNFERISEKGQVFESGTFINDTKGEIRLYSGTRFLRNDIGLLMSKINIEKDSVISVFQSGRNATMSIDSLFITHHSTSTDDNLTRAKQYKSFSILQSDTINKLLINNKKDGFWISNSNANNQQDYSLNDIYEIGTFNLGRRQDLFIRYYPRNRVMSIISYNNNRPNGAYVKYHKNGQIMEQGFWSKRNYSGYFKRCSENGQIILETFYTDEGLKKRSIYYYESGEVQLIVFYSANGKEKYSWGFYSNGDLKEKKSYENGVVIGSELLRPNSGHSKK